MVELSDLLKLETAVARQHWLAKHIPERINSLIDTLWTEAERREQSDPQSVEILVNAARDLAIVWRDRELDAIALRLEASMYRVLGQHDTALLRYHAAIDLYQGLGLVDEAARSAVGPLDTLMYLGQYTKALQLADWAILRMHEVRDDAVLSRLLVNQGNIYARIADYRAALDSYAEARKILHSLDQPQRIAMVEANEANILTNLNEFRRAENRYYRAREQFAEANLTGAVAQVDHNLGYLAFAQGEFQEALRYFARARSVFESQQSKIDVAYVDLYRAEIYLALNLWPEALAVAGTARPIFDEALMQWEAGQLYLIEAAVHRQFGHEDTSTVLLGRAHHIFTAENNLFWVAVTAANQGILSWQRGNLETARQLLTESVRTFIEVGAVSRAAQCHITLGQIALDAREYHRAEEHFQLALALVKATPLPAITYASHYGLGLIYQQHGSRSASIAEYKQAIAEIEQTQSTIGAEDYKMAFRRDKLAVYEALILLYLAQGDTDSLRAAFDLVERAKARGLLDTIARIDDGQTFGIPDELLVRYETLKQNLNWYYHRLHMRTDDKDTGEDQERTWLGLLQQHEESLEALWKEWQQPDLIAAPRNPVWTVSSTTLQKTLPPDTLLLEFLITDTHLLVFGLERGKIWSKQLPFQRAQLARLLQQLRFQFNKFSYSQDYRNHHADALLASTKDVLHALYKILLAPIPEIQSVRQIIVVPHGLLHAVPFHALWSDNRYLIETHTVSYAPSATILHRVLTYQHLTPQDPPLIMGLSDPTIPYVEEELFGLQQLFPAAQIRRDEQVTANSLLHEQWHPPFLHISTHAMFRNDNPNFSSLKMTDGWLTVNEIYHLATAAPLVTLSACETGRSEAGPGDELMGLCRGFFGIGTQSLVVSLWRVEDQSTAKLMVRFYEGLRNGEPVHQALRNAQLELLSLHHHPYYWAPFILTGNPMLHLPL